MAGELFPPDFFTALTHLARRPPREGGGARPWARAGRGLPGFEHRSWRPGADLRLADWRASARSSVPQLRLREEERGGSLLLLLDRSGSLAPGGIARRDLDQRRLALALGWLALEGGGRVVLVVPGAQPQVHAGFARRVALQKALEGLPPAAGADTGLLPVSLPAGRRPRLVALGDPWGGDPWWQAVAALAPACHDQQYVLMVLPEEDDPPQELLALRGAEDGQGLLADLAGGRAAWARAWERWLRRQQERARALGARPRVLRCPPGRAPAGSILERAGEVGLV